MAADGQGFWWKEEDADSRASMLIGAATALKQDQAVRTQAFLRFARLYGNAEMMSFAAREYASTPMDPSARVAFNVVESCVDTLAAKIAKNKPRPSFLTDGGNYEQRKRAKNLDKFVRGLFYETRTHETGAQVFVDACVFGLGAVHISVNPKSKRIEVERAFPGELFVDDADGLYGHPRQLLRRRLVAREVLLAQFPDCKTHIQTAKLPSDVPKLQGFGDVVEVWEAWHLPSSKGAGDGMHVIAIEGCELQSDEWTKECFPFAFLRLKQKLLGFWGTGLAEALQGIQIEMNRLVRSVSEQLRRKGRGRIFAPIGSKVVPAHLTNGIADIVYHTPGMPPTVDNNNSVAPEEFMQIDRLYQRAFQLAGISELSASGKKPSGLDAAVALREFNDIESERFVRQGQAYEQMFLDIAEVMIDLLHDVGSSGYKVKSPERHVAQDIDWKDVNLPRDSYVMQMFPVSSLPQTPAARRQAVKELMADGFIDKAEARRLLDFPDLEAESELGEAALDDVDATISAIIDAEDPKIHPPEQYQNLTLLQSRAQAAYLRLRWQEGASMERLDMLRTLITMTSAMLLASQQPDTPPAPPPAMGPPPGMPPMGPPTMGGDVNMTMNAPQPAAVPPLIPQ